MGSRRFVVLLFVLLAVTATLVSAQTFRGTILGTVTDTSGAVVPGATVKAKNAATGLERTALTSAEGNYSIPELPIGNYTVTVTQSGFQTASNTNVVVDVATERRVDIALKPGQVTDTVEVTGEAIAQVDTTNDVLGGTLDAQAIANIPVNGRDYTKLIYLNPGVAGSPDQISDSPGSFGTFSMNGSRGRSNNFLLDGLDNNAYSTSNQGFSNQVANPSPDAVAEFKVITSNFSAEYGRVGGAVVNVAMRSGTNQAKNRNATTTMISPRARPNRKPMVRSRAPTRLSSTMSENRTVMTDTISKVARKVPPSTTA